MWVLRDQFWTCSCGAVNSNGFDDCPVCREPKDSPTRKQSQKHEPDSELERQFVGLLKTHARDIPESVAQWAFHPSKHWRFDFAWPDRRIAVEIDGGLWINGAHTRALGIQNDNRKRQAARLMGWTVLVFTNLDFERDQMYIISTVRRVFRMLETDGVITA